VRNALPAATVEVLVPDFCGDPDAMARVLDAGPHVFNHNMETVARLYGRVRPQARYQQSLDLLYLARQYRRDVLTKSGLMVGLGETHEEVEVLLRELRGAEVDIATIGQYLQPTRSNLPVAEYVEPWRFRAWRAYGLAAGFSSVASGPLVRSSYMAGEIAGEARETR
jgi:lipoyl synthase